MVKLFVKPLNDIAVLNDTFWSTEISVIISFSFIKYDILLLQLPNFI